MNADQARLEDSLQSALGEAVEKLREGRPLLPALIRRRRARRWRRWFLAGACVAVAGGSVLLWQPNGPDTGDRLVLADQPPVVPDGQQPVSFHGVQLLVPKSWELNATRCGNATRDTVVYADGFSELCHSSPVAGLTVVHLALLDTPQGQQFDALATEPTYVEGRPARQGEGAVTPGGPSMTVLALADVGVIIAVEGPSTSREQMLSTVEFAPVDSLGCVANPDQLGVESSRRPGTDTRLLPPGANRVVVCRYAGGWLMRSTVLSETARQQLEKALGNTPDKTQGDPMSNCQEESRRGFKILATYPSGPGVHLLAHLSGCRWSVTNGSVTTGINRALNTVLMSAVGYDGTGDYTQLP